MKNRVAELLAKNNIDAILISNDVNNLYVTGEIFGGYTYITAQGEIILFSKYADKVGEFETVKIRKPEQIPELLGKKPQTLSLDDESSSAADWIRLSNAFSFCNIVTRKNIMRTARIVKTPSELEKIKKAAEQQMTVYSKIPELFEEGMTDTDLAIKLEGALRKCGHNGIFRTHGFHMECFMGSLLCGQNGEEASVYDFALGGKGATKALPIGACGDAIKAGDAVMVDYSGCYDGYLCDMTRTFFVKEIAPKALYAHNVSIEIQELVQPMLKEGVCAFEIWEKTLEIVKKHSLEGCFMGLSKQSKFVGHGVGLEINEPPVMCTNDKTPLEQNTVLAIEPKFVIKGIGAVGVEDTYTVEKNSGILLTDFERKAIII